MSRAIISTLDQPMHCSRHCGSTVGATVAAPGGIPTNACRAPSYSLISVTNPLSASPLAARREECTKISSVPGPISIHTKLTLLLYQHPQWHISHRVAVCGNNRSLSHELFSVLMPTGIMHCLTVVVADSHRLTICLCWLSLSSFCTH